MIATINKYFSKHTQFLVVGIVVATLITLALTLLPADKVLPQQVWAFDKFGHLCIFGGWTFLLGYYCLIAKPQYFKLFGLFLTGVFFGGLIEVLQYYSPFRRKADIFDLAFDSIGCFLAILVLHKIAEKKRGNKLKNNPLQQ